MGRRESPITHLPVLELQIRAISLWWRDAQKMQMQLPWKFFCRSLLRGSGKSETVAIVRHGIVKFDNWWTFCRILTPALLKDAPDCVADHAGWSFRVFPGLYLCPHVHISAIVVGPDACQDLGN